MDWKKQSREGRIIPQTHPTLKTAKEAVFRLVRIWHFR